MSGQWWLSEWAALDLETTGLDVESDRIVQAALVWTNCGVVVEERTWLADAGQQPVPAEATKLHKIPERHAHRYGRPAGLVAEMVAQALAGAVIDGLPIVVANAPYDLTLHDRELERDGRWSLAVSSGHSPLRVLDPLLLDRVLDPYREGRRRLVDLCEHYEVEHEGPHRADADAAAAAAVAFQIVGRFPELRQMSLQEVHDRQVGWALERAAARERRLRKTDPTAVVDGSWPLIPRQEVTR
ncbi:exonuclease domain-containing protein [Kitasatospora sp. NPDC057692]|uniref:exonuclease domain-containing protein n=1 Tax=Kitasatospora sp. NPDC057692 TaxID=3346215 RepID=UPI0036CEBD0A